jgi:hypothetical protein
LIPIYQTDADLPNDIRQVEMMTTADFQDWKFRLGRRFFLQPSFADSIPIIRMKIRPLDLPKLDPERIRSFTFCQPKKDFNQTIWFH